MNQSLSTQSDLHPVSFTIGKAKLSSSQMIIIRLMNNKISASSPITEDDIVNAYFEATSPDGKTVRIRYGLHGYGSFSCIEADKSHPEARSRAINWFKSNIGGCIIKGRLLVIPIIEIE